MLRFVIFLTAVALAIGMAVPVAAAKPEATGPACAHIEVTANYVTDPDTGPTVTFLFDSPLESCPQVTYSVFVNDGTSVITESKVGDGGQIGFAIPIESGASTVCVSATSSSAGGKVFDPAPDTGCVSLTLDAGGGAQKFT